MLNTPYIEGSALNFVTKVRTKIIVSLNVTYYAPQTIINAFTINNVKDFKYIFFHFFCSLEVEEIC